MKHAILITGGTGNLGKAVIEKFRKNHTVLALVRKTPDQPTEHVQYYETDLTNEKQTAETLQSITQHYTITTAILTTGGFAGGSLHETSLDTLNQLIAHNFHTVYTVVRPVFEHMKAHNSGRIILIGARPGIKPENGSNMVGYTLAKSMIMTLAQVLNASGKKHNIVTSVIVPGTIDTPENRNAMPGANTSNWVQPDAIAEVIHFLCSKQAEPVREVVIPVWGNS